MNSKITIISIASILIIIFSISLFWLITSSPTTSVSQMMSKRVEIPQLQPIFTTDTIETKGDALGDGAIISRAIKQLSGYRHYGVMYNKEVIHYNQYGIQKSTLDEFANHDVIKVERKGLSGIKLEEFRSRYTGIVKKYANTKYDAAKNNCEHFVTELVLGVKDSKQIKNTKALIREYEPYIYETLNKGKFAVFTPFIRNKINEFMVDSFGTDTKEIQKQLVNAYKPVLNKKLQESNLDVLNPAVNVIINQSLKDTIK